MIDESKEQKIELVKTEKGLYLQGGGLSMRGDFEEMLPRLKMGRLQGEMLVKAAKIKNFEGTIKVLDATAGMGEDSILLAGAGFDVTLYERDEIISALLEDALIRASKNDELSTIVSRMHLRKGDSIEAMRSLAQGPDEDKPDVILLDPMFPERQKSGLVKKKFQLIHHLEKPCEDEIELLEAAFSVCPKRIVIKRPLKGPWLADKKPSYSLPGKAIRYDVHIIA